MSLSIRHSTPDDLPQMQHIFADARQKMIAAGNPHQWADSYPSDATLLDDMAHRCSYIVEQEGQAIATFVLAFGIEPTYQKIYEGAWLDEGPSPNPLVNTDKGFARPYATIHRIASLDGVHGIADFVFRWAFTQIDNIRIDTHRDNKPMQHLLDKNGFRYCGIIYLEDGDERLAYQRCLNILKP